MEPPLRVALSFTSTTTGTMQRPKRRGTPRRIPNEYATHGDGTSSMIVRQRTGKTHTYLIDTADLELVKAYQWHVTIKAGHVYALTKQDTSNGRTMMLQRLLANTPGDLECRFIDGNAYNCRRRNLANGTRHDTMSRIPRARLPKSGFPYVNWMPKTSSWKVVIRDGKRKTSLGAYDTVREAKDALDRYEAEQRTELRRN
jgi:hypothetical protein